MSTFSNPKEWGQNRPKSELPSSIGFEPKMQISGQCMSEWQTGWPSQNRLGSRFQRRVTNNSILCILFCLLLTFNNIQTKEITIGSHNLHSFKSSGDYHKSCLKLHGGIWFGQELWLTEKQLPLLHQLDTQFTARSGMEEAVSSGVLRGRPHGGVSIAWSPDLNHVISPLSNYKHKRVIAVELKTANESIIFISIYMPFLDSSNRTRCIADYTDAVSMIELILNDHPQHLCVLGGDLNCELTGDSPFDDIWKEFVVKKRFAYCGISSPPGYTYHHVKLGHKKMNDHFLVSHELLSGGNCSKRSILEEGENPSDHLPITMLMSVNIPTNRTDHAPSSAPPTLKWNKVSAHHIQKYNDYLSSAFQSRSWSIPSSCDGCHCIRDDCRESIQQDYEFVISALGHADSVLPRYGPGIEKDWWTSDLSILKEKSIDIPKYGFRKGVHVMESLTLSAFVSVQPTSVRLERRKGSLSNGRGIAFTQL